ncbi:hypothetical protein HDU92_003754 [Lobulomyces angularis]|nr:hypothetical protein HDU92_003754 [Lobulomyces angularis]
MIKFYSHLNNNFEEDLDFDQENTNYYRGKEAPMDFEYTHNKFQSNFLLSENKNQLRNPNKNTAPDENKNINIPEEKINDTKKSNENAFNFDLNKLNLEAEEKNSQINFKNKLKSLKSEKSFSRKRKKLNVMNDEENDDELSDEDFNKYDGSKIAAKLNKRSFQDHLGFLLILSSYIQIFFTSIFFGALFWFFFKFFNTIRHDLNMKAEEYSLEIVYQISECSKLYVENNCDPKVRIPYMKEVCNNWEICMMKDPKEVAKMKIGVEVFAEILNKLVEPLSYKSMIFTLILIFGSIFLMTFASNLLKKNRKQNKNSKSKNPQQNFIYIPTPTHPLTFQDNHFSNNYKFNKVVGDFETEKRPFNSDLFLKPRCKQKNEKLLNSDEEDNS